MSKCGYDVHIIRDITDGCADDLKTRARLDIQGGFNGCNFAYIPFYLYFNTLKSLLYRTSLPRLKCYRS